MTVKQVKSQQEYNEAKGTAELLVVDFFATWCGPCKAISPRLELLSAKPEYQAVTFIKVDVDQVKTVAQHENITAMPTFIFYKNGTKVDEFKGADPHRLESKIKEHAAQLGARSTSSKQYVRGMTSLNDKIELKQLEIANVEDASQVRNLFDASSQSNIKSDSDEQLMIYIPFQESLRVHSLVIRIDPELLAYAPAEIALYANRATILSFDDVDSVPSTQSLDKINYDADGEAIIGLRFVKFQRCNSLVIFIQQNRGSEDITMLRSVDIVGEVGVANSSGVVQKIDHEH